MELIKYTKEFSLHRAVLQPYYNRLRNKGKSEDEAIKRMIKERHGTKYLAPTVYLLSQGTLGYLSKDIDIKKAHYIMGGLGAPTLGYGIHRQERYLRNKGSKELEEHYQKKIKDRKR